MHIRMLHEQLVQAITHHGRLAAEATQVSKRLKSLLPSRLKQIKMELQRYHRGEKSTRLALMDSRLTNYIDELVNTSATAREARIQHETHRMLYEARVSLRRVNLQQNRQSPRREP
jgi:hypothetical protein